ncbi:hypothetical protein N9Y48_00810 [Zobellia sp.]|nr:hypothetical protein [Zobellia sp.]
MKNLMFAAVLSLGTMTAFAQEVPTTEEVPTTTEVPAVEEAAAEAIAPQEDAYAEVAVEEVPAAITEALEVAHPGATISKAYLSEAAEYKLEVATESGEAAELYADAEGNWIEK